MVYRPMIFIVVNLLLTRASDNPPFGPMSPFVSIKEIVVPRNISTTEVFVYSSAGYRTVADNSVIFDKPEVRRSVIRIIRPRSVPSCLIPPRFVRDHVRKLGFVTLDYVVIVHSINPSAYPYSRAAPQMVNVAMVNPGTGNGIASGAYDKEAGITISMVVSFTESNPCHPERLLRI